jgi:hypothetical protein
MICFSWSFVINDLGYNDSSRANKGRKKFKSFDVAGYNSYQYSPWSIRVLLDGMFNVKLSELKIECMLDCNEWERCGKV